jgi:hypothetical protein
MGYANHSAASLRLFGDDLDPAEVTRLMGQHPSRSHKKGDPVRDRNGIQCKNVLTGALSVRRTGCWLKRVDDRKPEDLNGQISELLALLPSDLAIWSELSSRFRIDVFVGLFMSSSNDGLNLSSKVIDMLGQRRIELNFDIYDCLDAREKQDQTKVFVTTKADDN